MEVSWSSEIFIVSLVYSSLEFPFSLHSCFFKDRQQEAEHDSQYLTLFAGYYLHCNILHEFVYVRRDASSRAFSRWRIRCAQPIRLSYHPGLVEGSIFSRPGVLLTVPSEIFFQGQVKATEDHLTTAHFWAINEFTYYLCNNMLFLVHVAIYSIL